MDLEVAVVLCGIVVAAAVAAAVDKNTSDSDMKTVAVSVVG